MANIMRDAINASCIPEANRPRIVGLTASFVNGKTENLISKRHDLEALLLARMWAPSLDLAVRRSHKWQRVDGWAYPQNGKDLEQWAKRDTSGRFTMARYVLDEAVEEALYATYSSNKRPRLN